MHALAWLVAFVDPLEVFYRPAIIPRRTEIRFGDKPDPEARALRGEARRISAEPTLAR
jgi:hypothetical protein